MEPRKLDRRGLFGVAAALAAAGMSAACRSTTSASANEGPDPEDDFGELPDLRVLVAPISSEERSARRARLATLLRRHALDAYLCEGGPTMSYLSGVTWGRSERTFALLVLADGSHFWLCPAFEAEKARLSVEAPKGPGGDLVRWEEHEYAFAPLAAALKARRAERVAVDPQARFFVAEGLRAELGHERVVSGREVVTALRGIKDAHELELLRVANEGTQLALGAVSHRVRLGMRGDDVAKLMSRAHAKLGMNSPWSLALVGPAAAYPHGDNQSIALARGDFLLVDTGASLHGYASDITRTWCVEGAPSEAQQRAWHAVRDAQARAFDLIAPGVECREVDRAARASLEAAGYGSGYAKFTHRLGHGIGMEGHEDPYFDGGSCVKLEPGMTLSNEPGVYLYGEFGVRIEDIVACTASGATHFGAWQRGWSSPT
jgi:Xaa-Pro dipeptidase